MSKADASSSIVVAPATQELEAFISMQNFVCREKLFTISKILKVFVVPKRDSQKNEEFQAQQHAHREQRHGVATIGSVCLISRTLRGNHKTASCQ